MSPEVRVRTSYVAVFLVVSFGSFIIKLLLGLYPYMFKCVIILDGQ